MIILLTLILPGIGLTIAGAPTPSYVALGFGFLLLGLDCATGEIVRALKEAADTRGEGPDDELVAALERGNTKNN